MKNFHNVLFIMLFSIISIAIIGAIVFISVNVINSNSTNFGLKSELWTALGILTTLFIASFVFTIIRESEFRQYKNDIAKINDSLANLKQVSHMSSLLYDLQVDRFDEKEHYKKIVKSINQLHASKLIDIPTMLRISHIVWKNFDVNSAYKIRKAVYKLSKNNYLIRKQIAIISNFVLPAFDNSENYETYLTNIDSPIINKLRGPSSFQKFMRPKLLDIDFKKSNKALLKNFNVARRVLKESSEHNADLHGHAGINYCKHNFHSKALLEFEKSLSFLNSRYFLRYKLTSILFNQDFEFEKSVDLIKKELTQISNDSDHLWYKSSGPTYPIVLSFFECISTVFDIDRRNIELRRFYEMFTKRKQTSFLGFKNIDKPSFFHGYLNLRSKISQLKRQDRYEIILLYITMYYFIGAEDPYLDMLIRNNEFRIERRIFSRLPKI